MLTNGTDEALSLVVNAFVEPGDAVLLVEPTYAMYRFYAELAGARIVAPRYDASMCFPWNTVLAALRARPRVLFLPNPNSPTGNLLTRPELRKILRAAAHTMVVIDEAYFEFSGVTVIPWIRRHRNLIVTRTFSKTAGLAGLRLGCIFVHRDLGLALRKAQSPYPVNAAALVAAEAAMKDRAFIARTVREVRHSRVEFARGMKRLGVQCFPSAGNFVLVHFGERAKRIVAALGRKGILVRDRSSDFDGEGYVRITLGTLATDAAPVARTERNPMRKAALQRTTKETDIRLRLNLDGRGKSHIATGVRFFDHMLEQIARHGGLDLDLVAHGDLDVDQHHTR